MIQLLPFTPAHANTLISWIHQEEEMVLFAGPLVFTWPLTVPQVETYLQDASRRAYVAVSPDSQELIGMGEIYHEPGKSPRLCRILIGNPAYRGKGVGQQIVDGLLVEAFADKTVEAVMLYVYDFNTSAIRCYEKCGFTINPDAPQRTGWNTWRTVQMILRRDMYEREIDHS